jgi:uncharacterized coiled-coil protein SlyX
MDEQSFVTRNELESAINRIEDRMNGRVANTEREVSEHGKTIARIETMLANLEDLPSILNSLNLTLVRLDGRICNVETGITKLEKRAACQSGVIEKIDEKGKIDWIEAVKKNWWGIILFIAAIVMLLKSQGVF